MGRWGRSLQNLAERNEDAFLQASSGALIS